MIYRINQIRAALDYNDKQIETKVLKITGLESKDINYLKIIRRSIDARKAPIYILTVEIKTAKRLKITRDVQTYVPKKDSFLSLKINNYSGKKPVIVGAGPAGLMAALILAENGVPPIIIERGETTDNRAKSIKEYLQSGELKTESNILFGEGGAGLFSDGKLTARSKERRITNYFFKKLIECGAPKNILIDAEPHLGSDLLMTIIPKLREKIINLGGEFHFNTKMENLEWNDGKISGIITKNKTFDTEKCILATGHSARDVYKSLSKNNIQLSPKAFAIGVRVELPQENVDIAQYGKFANDPRIGAASFRLTRKAEENFRSCYTFCTCPGGEVMPCASSNGEITTNGMSLSKRDGNKANTAFLVPVNESDYSKYYNEEYPALSGIFFQEYIERKIFNAGGKNYSIPVARLSDFLTNKMTFTLPKDSSCKRINPTKINGILPKFVESTLKHSIPKMIAKLGRPEFKDILIYCGETRSSSPVRIDRDAQSMESNMKGLYPCGEGSGFAGGIVSSAIDGIKSSESLLKSLK